MGKWLDRVRRFPLLVVSAGVFVVVLAIAISGHDHQARLMASVYVTGFVIWTAVGMLRQLLNAHFGLDILAVVAMVSTVVVGEYIAALIVVLMLTGGEALENYASGRAQRELNALLARAPRQAHLVRGEEIVEVDIAGVGVGDVLMVKSAEVIPVDGELISGSAQTDESSITGESLPVSHTRGEVLLSGAVNLGSALELRATAAAADSQYQQIVALVEQAQRSKAPVVRLADRFAIPFTAVSLMIGAIAWWWSKDPTRFAEVLVLATPCPLLIAAPVAFISGMSRSAKQGVIVKGGAGLEQLARARTAAFDKTGTLTSGKLSLVRSAPAAGFGADELLQLVMSAERYSTHALAPAVIAAGEAQGISTLPGSDAREVATDGIEVTIDGRHVAVGKPRFIQDLAGQCPTPDLRAGELGIHAAVDGAYAGSLIMRDPLRHNAISTLAALRQLGVEHRLILTGDSAATAAHVAAELGVEDVRAELLPADKVRIVRDQPLRPVLMVGDGVNDAPVLAAADVGIAMGARGATAASESAGAVVLADDIGKVATAVSIAQTALRAALSAIWLGIGLSVLLMLVAAFGFIPAVFGALTQELVDLAAIGLALTALRPHRREVHP